MKIRLFLLTLSAVIVLTLSGCGQSVALFNGENLDGWQTYLEDKNIDPATVWSVKDGVIHCKGKPNGFIRTLEDYSNYALHLEWRWVNKPTNSGVLLHSTGDNKIWPLCIEAQLKHEHAGDFVTIQQGSAVTVNGQRVQPPAGKIFNVAAKQHDSNEKPAGQWNSYDIVCKDDTITLTVNGILQNTATNTSLTSGAISLQSEGSPIEFRNITITPLQ